MKEAPIESREEGVVLYLVKRFNSGKEELVSLCKLKTLEYQVFRKLREKLRSVHDRQERQDRPALRAAAETAFEAETRGLLGDCKLPQELGFYLDVAKRAFEFAGQHEEQLHLVFGQFVSFLSVGVYCAVNQLPVALGYFETSVLAELQATPWSRYGELKKKLRTSEGFAPKTPRTIVFIPLTLPGTGKTYLYREVLRPYCEENGLLVRQVCSDALHRTEMDRLRPSHPGATEHELYNKAREAADEAFNRTLIHHLKEKSLEDKVIFIEFQWQ